MSILMIILAPKLSSTFIEIGNQKQNHKIENQQPAYIWSWKHLINFNFYQNYRQRYTVIPITTVRGPLIFESV